jgi:hypothetical protein
VISVYGSNAELQGGLDLGLYPGTIVTVNKGENQIAKLKIVENKGFTHSRAEILKNENMASPEPGDMGYVTQWAFYEVAELRLWLGDPLPDATLAEQIVYPPILAQSDILLVGDPAREPVDLVVRQSKDGWKYFEMSSGTTLAPGTEVAKVLADNPRLRVFLQLAPDGNLISSLRERLSNLPAVTIVDSPNTAHYVLTCAPSAPAKGLMAKQCAWLLPNQHSQDHVTALPVSTEWIGIDPARVRNAVSDLQEMAFRLARLKSWVSLSSPPAKRPFPYELELWKADNNEVVDPPCGLEYGETYKIMLVSHSEDLQNVMRRTRERYVYVGGINSDGKGYLLYPKDSIFESCATLPCKPGTTREYKHAYPIKDDYTVSNYDTDVLYVITSESEIPSYASLLSFEGVRTRHRGPTEQLSQLELVLSATNLETRSRSATPMNWSTDQILLPVREDLSRSSDLDGPFGEGTERNRCPEKNANDREL